MAQCELVTAELIEGEEGALARWVEERGGKWGGVKRKGVVLREVAAILLDDHGAYLPC
jgi:hypothetical protein